MIRFRVVRQYGGGPRLWISKPYARNCVGLKEPRFSSRESAAFLWATEAAAAKFAVPPLYPDDPVTMRVEPIEVDAGNPTPYAVSDDPVVPGMVVETGRSKGGRRVTFKAV